MKIKKVKENLVNLGGKRKIIIAKSLQTPKPKATGDGNMTLKKVKEIAKSKGINPGKMKKAEIIKEIQRFEGNFDCFGTAIVGYCDQEYCMWRIDCLGPKKNLSAS